MIMIYDILSPHSMTKPSGYAVNIFGSRKIPPRSTLATQLNRPVPADDGGASKSLPQPSRASGRTAMIMIYDILSPHSMAKPSGYAVNIFGSRKIPPQSTLATQLSCPNI